MDTKMVAVFDNEKQAFEASQALQELHRDGSIMVYSEVVIEKSDNGTVQVHDSSGGGIVGAAMGASVGSLVGTLGGPAGVLVGATVGGLTGFCWDNHNDIPGSELADEVADKLENGKFALVAEIDEQWTTPVDARIEKIGGTIIRQSRINVDEGQFNLEIEALEAELDRHDAITARLEEEFEEATGEAKDKLAVKVKEARNRLDAAIDHAHTQFATFKAESEAKIESLNQRVESATAESKEYWEQQLETAQADYKTRSRKMKQAWMLTEEAFAAS